MLHTPHDADGGGVAALSARARLWKAAVATAAAPASPHVDVNVRGDGISGFSAQDTRQRPMEASQTSARHPLEGENAWVRKMTLNKMVVALCVALMTSALLVIINPPIAQTPAHEVAVAPRCDGGTSPPRRRIGGVRSIPRIAGWSVGAAAATLVLCANAS